MAIREILIAPEAVPGTAAAGTYIKMRVMKFTPANQPKLDKPRETTGSTIVLQRARPGAIQFDWSFQARMYFDLSVHWFAMYHGVPTVNADPGGATGVKEHLFKPGGVSPLSYTIRWKQTGSGGTIWNEATGCRLKQLKITANAQEGPVLDGSGHGLTYTPNISAPSVPSDLTAAYNQPLSMDQQQLATGAFTSPASPGTAWVKPKQLALTNDNGLTPDWSIRAFRAAQRTKMGDSVLTGDITAFWDAYVGSLIEAGQSASQLFSQTNYVVRDQATSIGTGTPTKPTFYALLHKPYVESPTQDDTNTDQEEKATLSLGYDATALSNATYGFYNELAAAVYTGS